MLRFNILLSLLVHKRQVQPPSKRDKRSPQVDQQKTQQNIQHGKRIRRSQRNIPESTRRERPQIHPKIQKARAQDQTAERQEEQKKHPVV